jgi:hypothetical protein
VAQLDDRIEASERMSKVGPIDAVAEVYEIRQNGERGALLPGWATLTYQDQVDDVGSVRLEYAPDVDGYDKLAGGSEYSVWVNGKPLPNDRFLLSEHQGDPLKDTKGRITWAGQTLLGLLDEAKVVPLDDEHAREDALTDEERKALRRARQEFRDQQAQQAEDDAANKPSDKPKPHHDSTSQGSDDPPKKKPDDQQQADKPAEDTSAQADKPHFTPSSKLQERVDAVPAPDPPKFKKDTPGMAFLTLGRDAKKRGCIPQIKFGFTRDRDSAGNKWAEEVSTSVDVGTSLLDFVRWLRDHGKAEARMQGRTLMMYNVGHGVYRTDPRVRLVRGMNLVDGPRDGTTLDQTNAVYVLTDTNVRGWVIDRKAIEAADRRVESILNLSGVDTWDEAHDEGRRHLQDNGQPKEQRTYGIATAIDDDAVPYKGTYEIGDYIDVLEAGQVEKVRVLMITLDWDQDRRCTASVTTKDRVMRRSHKRQNRDKVNAATGKNRPDPTKRGTGLAPVRPSTPKVTGRNGNLTVRYDGRDENDEPEMFDVEHVELHVGDDQDFDATDDTMYRKISGAGSATLGDREYDVAQWVRFVAVRATGDRSDASEAVSAAAPRVQDFDIEELSVEKLTAGDLVVDVRITTGLFRVVGGAGVTRFRLDNAGLATYDSNAVRTTYLDFSNGQMTARKFVTGNDGTPRVYIVDDGDAAFPVKVLLQTGHATEELAPQLRTVAGAGEAVQLLSGHDTGGFSSLVELNPAQASANRLIRLAAGIVQFDLDGVDLRVRDIAAAVGPGQIWGNGTTPVSLNFLSSGALRVAGSPGDTTDAAPIQASAFNVVSSEKTKRRIHDADTGLRELRKVRVVDYERPGSGRRLFRGVISEEILEAVPRAHDADSTGVDIMGLLATTIAAVQELDERVESLGKDGDGQ